MPEPHLRYVVAGRHTLSPLPADVQRRIFSGSHLGETGEP